MPANEFLTWALGAGANIMSQSNYASNPAQSVGVQVGLADPTLYNKAQRQAAFIAHCIAQFVADQTNTDSVDDGNPGAFISRFENALVDYLLSTALSAIRIRVTADTTFFVDGALGTDDPSHGLSSGAGAFRTAQYGYEFIKRYYDFSGVYRPTLSMNGSVGGLFIQSLPVGANILVLTTTGAATLSTIGVPALNVSGGAGIVNVTGALTFTATGTNGAGISVGGGEVNLGTGLVFNGCEAAAIATINGGVVNFISPASAFTVIGNSVNMLVAEFNSTINLNVFSSTSITITLSGTPAYSDCTVRADRSSLVALSGVSFVGGATGQRYRVFDTSLIDTGGGGASFIPGTIAGGASNSWNYQ